MKIHSLRGWFTLHFIVDYIFAIPLFTVPVQTLTFFGWHSIDPIATRLVAAALFSVGGISLVTRNASSEVLKNILTMKIIWSLFAIVGVLLAAASDGVPAFGWVAVALFIVFALVWIYYYLRLTRG